MTALAVALAYLGTLAFVAWGLWLRWKGPPDLASRISAAEDAGTRSQVDARKALNDLAELRSHVESVSLKVGLSPKR